MGNKSCSRMASASFTSQNSPDFERRPVVRILSLFGLLLVMTASQANAQTDIALSGLNADPTAAIEVSADGLTVDQESRSAVFSGNVVIGHGDLRIAASRVEVRYSEETGDIAQLNASGGVTFVTANEAAESSEAVYDVTNGILTMNGQVLLTQGNNALSADRMIVNLASGTAQMDGRVRTVFRPGGE